MNLWDPQVWGFITTMSSLLIAMIVANIIRNTCTAIRRLMIPSSVLGGFLLLVVNFICKNFLNFSLYSTQTLEILTYHGLGLGFAALALRRANAKSDKESRTGAFDTGVTVANGYMLQAILGLVVTISLFYLMGSFFASGLLLPMGYGQGPGQAYNWGHTYELRYGFTDGTSFGLTVAAMGFVSASIGGILHLNWLRKKGIYKGELGANAQDKLTLETFTDKDEIPLAESMDKFTIQIALVFIAYAISFLFMKGVNTLLDPTGEGAKGLAGTIQGLIWGFQFLFASIFATLLKTVLRRLKVKGIIRREYSNDFMQNRISGFMFDLMVVASIAAIDLRAFTKVEFLLPLSIICLLGAVGTYIYLRIVCKKVFPSYEQEAFLSLYGMQTGTASTGTILLREMDPNFESPAAHNLVYHMPWAIPFAAPMLLMMGMAAQSVTNCLIALAVNVVLFAAFNVLLFRKSIFKKKKK